jgi:hypothetical protein
VHGNIQLKKQFEKNLRKGQNSWLGWGRKGRSDEYIDRCICRKKNFRFTKFRMRNLLRGFEMAGC